MSEVADPIKQVIVIRTRYPDGKGGTRKIRWGKLAAQAAHASMMFMTTRFYFPKLQERLKGSAHFRVSEVEEAWLNRPFTKICVGVETEEELNRLSSEATQMGLEAHLVKDNGTTEFGGEPTYTALAIGPDYASKIDPITGSLPLL